MDVLTENLFCKNYLLICWQTRNSFSDMSFNVLFLVDSTSQPLIS